MTAPDHIIKGALDALITALNDAHGLDESIAAFAVRVYAADVDEDFILVCFERASFIGVTSWTYAGCVWAN